MLDEGESGCKEYKKDRESMRKCQEVAEGAKIV